MRYPLIIAAGSLLLTGCKPDEGAQPPATPKVESAAPVKSAVEQPSAPAVSKPPEVKVVLAYEPPPPRPQPPVNQEDEEARKFQAYIRAERIRQIEAAKARVDFLMRAIEPEKIESDGDVLESMGLDRTLLLDRDTRRLQSTLQSYRDQKARARELQVRALEEAQSHLRSLLLGAEEKRGTMPVK